MKHLENVAERYIKASEKGLITYDQELHILEYLVNKLNLMTKSDYAKKEGISIAGVNSRIEREKVMNINLANRTFIL